MDCMSGVGAERGYRSGDVGLRNHGRKISYVTGVIPVKSLHPNN
jgi:hypothetical protein